MEFRRVVDKRIREVRDGLNVAADIKADVAVNVGQHGTAQHAQATKGAPVADQQVEYKQLSREELEQITGEELPERAAMALVNANLAIPINAAVAANVLSDNAIAYADASQITPIDQSTGGGG